MAASFLPAPPEFQPTLPHRERQLFPDLPLVPLHFNPRSRTGSDGGGSGTPPAGNISTHAPAQGAT